MTILKELKGESPLNAETTLIGIFALLAAEREERITTRESGTFKKTEVVLSDAGLTTSQIALILNKKPGTVAKTISRAKSKGVDSDE